MKLNQCYFIFSALLILISVSATAWGQSLGIPSNLNLDAAVEARIDAILQQMTLEEKALLLSGDTTGFDSRPIQRLGIPVLRMTDGPVGVRWGKSTAFPASICMAATWDPALIQQMGAALGRETKAKGRNVLLAPCVNIQRVPHGGRNFESFGEDPLLAAEMATAYIKGVQSEHVIATVKHFACNNQEFERNSIDVQVDTRTLHEIYLPAFKAAVQKGGVWAVMTAYNRLNGHYCSSNTDLLTKILKEEWGFPGLVMSDWGAVHSTEPTLYAGMDIEMPTARYLTVKDVVAAVQGDIIKESKINDKVRRLLRAMFAIGLFDPQEAPASLSDTPAHQQIAKQVAEAGIVLLKNEKNLLPFDLKKIKSIAVIGPNANNLRWGGGGSAYVTPNQAPSPLEVLKNQVGAKVKVRFAPGIFIAEDVMPIDSTALIPPAGAPGKFGLLGEYFDNINFQGEPVLKRVDRQVHFYWGNQSPDARVPVDYFSVRWTGKIAPSKTAQYSLNLTSDDGSRLYLEGKLLIDNWGNHGMLAKSAVVQLEAGKHYDVRIELYENAGDAGVILSWNMLDQEPIQAALDIAKKSDVTLIFAGNNHHLESEGSDRDALSLAANQVALIRQIAAVNPRTVVVLNSGAPVLINDWLAQVPVLIQSWFPGQAGGQAIADILLGNVNPSGKLPFTWLNKWEDSPASNNYPGQAGVVKYAEGIFVGYRYFDKNNLTPLFPFGYGLSYTTFEYQDLKISTPQDALAGMVTVSLSIKNTGTREGAEVVQLYVHDETASLERPPQELKGFQKVFLKPGASKTVVFELDRTAFAFYDPCQKQWDAEPGRFQIRVGNSSRDIRLQGAFELTQ